MLNSLSVQPVQALGKAAEKPQRRVAVRFDESFSRRQRRIRKNNAQLADVDHLMHAGFQRAKVARWRQHDGIERAGYQRR